MPFTPFHFGPHALVGLPLQRWLDVPLFVGVSVAVDLEPLLMLTLGLDAPLHGYAHTLLIGTLVGLAAAALAWPVRRLLGEVMGLLRLPYAPTFRAMVQSAVLGAWLHVLADATLYHDIRPFYPLAANPLLGLVSSDTVYGIGAASCLPVLALAGYLRRRGGRATARQGPAR